MILLLFWKVFRGMGFASKMYTITIDTVRSNNIACNALISDFERHGHFLFSSDEFCMLGALLTYLIWLCGMA